MLDAKSEGMPEVGSPAAPHPSARIVPKQRGKYRTAITWIVWSGVVGVAGVGGWLGYNHYFNRPPEPVAVTLLPVEKGTVEITVTESGTVELGGQQTLKSPREVTVEQVNVKEGDRVRAGQPLIVLRDRTVQDSVKDQLVDNAKYELDLTRKREKVAEAKEKLQAAETRFKESQDLLERGFISATDLQSDKDKLDQVHSEFKDAQVEHQKAGLDVGKGQEKLKGLQQQLADRVVTAPINGIVLKVDVKKGDGTKTESTLLTLGDPTKELVKLQLTTLNAAKVRSNQLVRVNMIGPNPKVFTGKIISLSPQATTPNIGSGFGDSSGGGQVKVDARVLLDKPSKTLISGSLVSVEIVTDQRQNVVVIPPEAVQRTEQSPFVWIKDRQGNAQKQPIILGLQGLQKVEVMSGLKLGNQLVLAPPALPLTPGIPLKVGNKPEGGIENEKRQKL